MRMSKYFTVAAILGSLWTAPGLGAWIHQGTDVYISEPESVTDPDGNWWYSWDAENTSVSADANNLDASGKTWGEGGISLWPYAGDPLSEWVYVSSYVYGRSTYDWDEISGGSRTIRFTATMTLSTSGVSYLGEAIDDTHVSDVTSWAGASAEGYSSASSLAFYSTGGEGEGFGTTQGSHDADNSTTGSGVTVTQNDTDAGHDAPLDYNKYYEGDLYFTASWTHSYSGGDPSADSFSVVAKVGGGCAALGDITINDPYYYYLHANAEASYSVDGTTEVDLFGNIQ